MNSILLKSRVNYVRCIDDWLGLGGLACSCPPWLKAVGVECVNVNECDWAVCENGGECQDVADERRYICSCPPGYTGPNCQLVQAGVIHASTDFFISFMSCLALLICEYFFF